MTTKSKPRRKRCSVCNQLRDPNQMQGGVCITCRKKEAANPKIQDKQTESKLIQVSRYTYYDGGLGAEVGDEVLLPASWVPGSEGRTGLVTAIGSDYTGPTKSILRIVNRNQEAAKQPVPFASATPKSKSIGNPASEESSKTTNPSTPMSLTVTATEAGTGTNKSSLADSFRKPKVKDDSPHVIIEALAGTGKTTTLICGIAYMFRNREV